MSDKTLRTIAEIQQEYGQVCVKAGNTQYQIVTLQKDLDLLNDALRDLNAEAFTVHELEQKAKAAAATPTETPSA